MSHKRILSLSSLLVIILIITSCTGNQLGPKTSSEESELSLALKLQNSLDKALEAGSEGHQLGVSAAIIIPGEETWIGVAGVSHPDTPITPEMLFDIGSAEKNLQATLVLKLIEEGLLNLDDPLYKWLKDYPNINNAITIRQLLNHTSGIYDFVEHPNSPWRKGFRNVDTTKTWTPEEVIISFVSEPYFSPGESWHYATTNYLVLNMIIEAATQSTVVEEIKNRFLKPLNLEHTIDGLTELISNDLIIAHPWYDANGDGAIEDMFARPTTWLATLLPNLTYASAGDMAKWIDTLYHQRTILTQDSLDEMLNFYRPTEDPDEPMVSGYGLGVTDFSDFLGVQVYGHGGSQFGYTTAALYLPEYGVTICWMINIGADSAAPVDAMMGNIWLSLSEVLFNHLN